MYMTKAISVRRHNKEIPQKKSLVFNWDLGSFKYGTESLYSHSLLEVGNHSKSKMHEICLVVICIPTRR